ncbi:MAG TPA: glycoside hydrolase family 9 protein [Steroidobacteraceae bacterium]|nr:glycoside hydrolase family 9 protein [Steroidobacteraceae bacterium]
MIKLFQRFLIPTLCMISACGGSSIASSETPVRGPANPGMSAQVPFNHHLLVDQFGYRPGDPKVAVVREAQVGYDIIDKFTPGATYRVRNVDDGRVVFSGTLTPWMRGTTQASSGDHGWWFDFSSVNTPGTYFIDDPERNLRSATFRIDDRVYANILKAATRMYFYQRSSFAKQKPYADACWTDAPAYVGPDQDTQAHDITDRTNRSKVKDLSGGWFDAGDTNKYVTFAAQAVHQLLTAYQENAAAFTDDFNIPESGNGVPDVLDEVKWETDWLKKMQYPNGSAALKVGEIGYAQASPPSSDTSARFYIPSCTSATIATAGMFAHASLVYGRIGALARESSDLKTRAVNAWSNYQKTPKQLHCDTGEVKAGNADWSEGDQNASAALAAIYLFAITDAPEYDKYIKAHYKELKPYNDIGWSRYNADQGEALLFYTTLPHADPELKKTVLADKLRDVKAGSQIYGFNGDDDLYRAFLHDLQYHWGSNNPRAQYGNTNMDVVTYALDASNNASYQTRGLEILHYFHGVNPFAMVYLSNMYSYGATRSANEIYHSWFWHGSRWSDSLTSECGPAPGYVPGGPNAFAGRDVPHTLVPPTGQPPQKSYRDWNVGWPEASWVVAEPGIYYQSGYVKLLSKFVR